ncbi:ExbD/TolR family protein [Flagellimonas meridianipacifica]|uniref:Biopolymer transport protein ExbD n=1 Tax=Flagellimonas meridianipacifica TaxID=1080225 RepID=A0A2T0MJB9_9FLAO|nr:biopolymer transporter ExbD [Allomuricauda pacifica]PRX57653.1 biopolymer transport protein ExbD [Allomuricauda pacifica]
MRKTKKRIPSVSTASLPDIVFMLLFFFMTVTTIKDTEMLVENKLPEATELSELDKKDRIIEIFVGKPTAKYSNVLGTEPKIQLNKKLFNIEDVRTYVLSELAKKPEGIRNLVTVSLKIDENVHVGLVSDIKKELQDVNLLKINYAAIQGNYTSVLD